MGVDVGSVSTDAVLINDRGELCAYSIVKSGFDHKNAIKQAIAEVCQKAGVRREDVKGIVSTGYGRRNVSGALKVITEISCHAMGIHSIFPQVRTVIDIGGQDSKVIHVTDNGFVDTFVMNDKCAAGTGRFLEVMANAMGVGVDELGMLSRRSKKVQPISSICTVFAESEVISRIAEGSKTEDIIAGIHRAIGERLMGMVSSIGIRTPIAVTGGVAKNSGVVKAVSDFVGSAPLVPDEPQIIGALGAAIYAMNNAKSDLELCNV